MVEKNAKSAMMLSFCTTSSLLIATPYFLSSTDDQLVHRAILRMDVNEEVEFEVGFDSDRPLSVESEMTLQVEDNRDNNAVIQVTGEAYLDMVSLYNLSSSSQAVHHEDDEEGKKRKWYESIIIIVEGMEDKRCKVEINLQIHCNIQI